METEPSWEHVRDAFLDVAELPEAEREAALQGLHARDPLLAQEVRRLLRHDRAAAANAAAPRRFGPYEVVRPLGAGGMGEVFVGRRADGEFEREVAIKVLRGGATSEDLVQRFLRERQTLARLDHEYIARLLDGGTTESGEPYLVMEYVDGVPADVFAASLDLRGRLELFIRIGRAVAHAHDRGVVHRDLKPSNILVRTDGTPRLLDFGIARPDPETVVAGPAEAPLTRTGHRLFTPEYASPEQVLGEVASARSDVFALGVLLYVFLCGRTPWKSAAGLHELERSICDDDPVPPSRQITGTARRRVAGDLDAVVLHCLEKRPSRRYASVAALCDDLERHLAGMPIRARRTGAAGRLLRYARRRPARVTAALLALALLSAMVLVGAAERRDQRRRAELTTAIEDRIATARARWEAGGTDAAISELEAALVALQELPSAPGLKARVLAQKAVFANMQRDWEVGLQLVDAACSLLAGSEAEQPQLMATLLNTRAFALQRSAPGDRSRAAAEVALDYACKYLPPGDVLRADAVLAWAEELQRDGDAERALELIAHAAHEVEQQQEPDSEIQSRLLNELALGLVRLERPAEAAVRYREALDILKLHHGTRHPAVMKVRYNLGACLVRLHRFEEAARELEPSLEASRLLGDEFLAAANQHMLAWVRYRGGDDPAAEADAREAAATFTRLDHGDRAARSRCVLGLVLARTERTDEARRVLVPVLADAAQVGLWPEMEAEAQHRLGTILMAAEGPESARPHFERALELKLTLLGDGHPDCQALVELLAR